jgi:hypothetical protein
MITFQIIINEHLRITHESAVPGSNDYFSTFVVAFSICGSAITQLQIASRGPGKFKNITFEEIQ